MADNTAQNGTDTIATDDIGGIKYQRVKATFGVDGTATDVSASNPFPVDASGVAVPVTDNGSTLSVDDGAGSLTVDGSVSIAAALPAGTNNIGDMDVVTMPAAGRTTDSISAALATDIIMSSLTELTPKFAKISASASGATTVVSAVTGKKIRVLRWDLVVASAVNVKWQSHVTPTDETGLYEFAANGGISAPFSPVGHFQTVSGEALDINLSGAVTVGGSLTYVEV